MTITERKNSLVQYMQVKIAEEDWHGVSDAANDLRELEVEERLLEKAPLIACAIGRTPL